MSFSLITLEHSRLAYRLDFVATAAAVTGLGLGALATRAGSSVANSSALVLAGWVSWTLLEYGLHRFVLHGVQPFRRWHALHHQRPAARIYAPTWLSGALVAGGVLLPMWWLAGRHVALAFTFGLVLGNLGYAWAHHVAHHVAIRGGRAWPRRLRAWHVLHHGRSHARAHYGVSTALWDHVFRTAHPRPAPGRLVDAAHRGFGSAQTRVVAMPTTEASNPHPHRKNP